MKFFFIFFYKNLNASVKFTSTFRSSGFINSNQTSLVLRQLFDILAKKDLKQFAPTFFIFLLLLLSCNSNEKDKVKETDLVIRQSTDANTLNPVSAGDQLSVYLSNQLFQPLIGIDFKTGKTIAILADKTANIDQDSSGNMLITYTIKNTAQFNAQMPVTAKDVLFSLKLNIAPSVNNVGGVHYFDFVEGFQFYENDPKKFTIVCKSSNVHNVFRSGDFSILPQDIYDSSKILDSYSISQLKSMEIADEKLLTYAEQFNKRTTSTLTQDFQGSGAYRLKKWNKGERIILEKKKNWWGDQFAKENLFFVAKSKNIRYEIVPDATTAIAALKSKQVDFVSSIPLREFNKLDSTDFHLESPLIHGYIYLGFNLKDSILKQLAVRKAIEACLPIKKMIDIIYGGKATSNRLPLALQQQDLRNNNLILQNYDLAIAKELLQQAGWEDTDQDGILDKVMNGESKALKINYHYNSGNEQRKEIGLLLQAELEKVGIKLALVGIEWTQYLKLLKKGTLQLFINGRTLPSLTPDFTMLFHSNGANGGRNYANYQNKKTDELIESIKTELNDSLRRELIFAFQSQINEDKPYLFLFSKTTNIAISKRLKSTPIYSIRPHFWAPEFH